MAKIYDLQDIPCQIMSQVGGKARGLNKLMEFGYTVPEAFICTDISDDDDFSQLAEKYLSSGLGIVSVRSSATLEDGKEFSAAGQFSTFLNVDGVDNVVKASADCVSSLNNFTATHYSKTFLQNLKCGMTVIVQKMVNAKCAGVIFSKAPMRPGYVLVEAVEGLGENLVSGKKAAQQYRVRGGYVEKMPVNSILSREQAIALGEAGKRAEMLFGTPMDLEWAIDQDDNIQWLQARPITVGESVTMNELDTDLDSSHCVFTTGNIGEVMPGAVTPLNLSTNMYSLDWAVMKTYLEIGAIDRELPPYSFIASYYNHMFFNMSTMYLVSRCVFGTTKETMDVSICGKVLEGMPDCDAENKPFFVKMKNMFPFLRLVFGGERARKGMEKTVSSLRFNLEDDMSGLYRQILDNFKLMKMAHYYHYNASYYSGGASAMLSTMLDKDFDDKDMLASSIAGCLTQIDDFESANILRSMMNLARVMIEDEPATAHASDAFLEDYFAHGASERVMNAYNDFMSRHGYRGIRENELLNLPWRDNRESFFSSLKSVLATVGMNDGREDKPWTSYAEEILCRYKGAKRKSVEKAILKARKGVCYREFTKSKVIYVVDCFRQAYRSLASKMVDAHLLPDNECIFFLTQDEVGRVLKGENSLVKKALARRRLLPQQMDLKFPYASYGTPQPVSVSLNDSDAASMSGNPVSRGIASGIARVVRDESDAALLCKGEIMVAACTDIGWSPYYSIIGGLITEIGSALSHGVVVAREYALTTVVNVENAMSLIHTGDHITIDGNSGSIIINRRGDM